MTTSLRKFYSQHFERTAFTDAFLQGANLASMQKDLAYMVFLQTHIRTPPIQFDEGLLNSLMMFARTHKSTRVSKTSLQNANKMFMRSVVDGLVWEANYSDFYGRWCSDGIPDPNNIPLPLPAGKTDMTVDTSPITMTHPWGGLRPQF